MDLNEILNRRQEDMPDTKPVPTGVYRLQILGHSTQEVGVNATPKLRWRLKTVDVVEADIDNSQLGLAEPVAFEQFLTDKTLAQRSPIISAKAFLNELGLEWDLFREGLEAAIGQVFKAKVSFGYEGQNKDIPRSRVSRILHD